MSDKPKRRLWQIHLSTAIVLMFVAGVLIFLNISPHQAEENWGKMEDFVSGGQHITYGFPRECFDDEANQMNTYFTRYTNVHGFVLSIWKTNNLIIDVLFAITIFVAVTIACEWLIRRREARKP